MKKKILLILILCLVVGITSACGSKKNDEKKEENAKSILNSNSTDSNDTKDNSNLDTKKNDKKLVVYFSKTGENYNVGTVKVGNTAMMASYIKDYLKADSFEIVPVNSYPDNYKKATDIAKQEQNDNARPKIKNKMENLSDYDTIFIGYPIWWGDLPMIVYTFLENYDFSGKTVIPFNTHEGSGSSGTYETIKEKLKDSTVNTNGLALTGTEARKDSGKEKTINWLKELGY